VRQVADQAPALQTQQPPAAHRQTGRTNPPPTRRRSRQEARRPAAASPHPKSSSPARLAPTRHPAADARRSPSRRSQQRAPPSPRVNRTPRRVARSGTRTPPRRLTDPPRSTRRPPPLPGHTPPPEEPDAPPPPPIRKRPTREELTPTTPNPRGARRPSGNDNAQCPGTNHTARREERAAVARKRSRTGHRSGTAEAKRTASGKHTRWEARPAVLPRSTGSVEEAAAARTSFAVSAHAVTLGNRARSPHTPRSEASKLHGSQPLKLAMVAVPCHRQWRVRL
jgi:hypothetical protein